MESSTFFRVIKPLVSIVCLILIIESLRTGTTLAVGRTGFSWVSQDMRPVGFWFANLALLAFAVLGLLGPLRKGRKS